MFVNRKRFALFFAGVVSFILLTGFDLDIVQGKLEEADKLVLDGKYTEAEQTFNEVFQEINKENPNPQEELSKNIVIPRIYFRLGEVQYKQGEYENAKSYFRKTADLQFKSYWNVKAFYNIGLIDYELKRYSEARDSFSRVVTEYLDSEEAPQAQYYAGLSYEMEDNKIEAERAFRKFINLFPKHPWVEKVKTKL
ncbi:MAG: tetratricopeptide repeat protein [bacterium]